MCGITLLVERSDDTSVHGAPCSLFKDDHLARSIQARLLQRGPDHFGTVDRATTGAINGDNRECAQWRIRFCSAVLHLRGDALTPQPIEDAAGNILCWNGEVFTFDGRLIDQGNDTTWLSEQLHTATEELPNAIDQDNLVTQRALDIFQRIHGPFSFVWFHTATQRVFFGHDRFGRRSLLVHTGTENDRFTELATRAAQSNCTTVSESINDLQCLVLSSVTPTSDSHASVSMQFSELPATGIYVLDLHHERLEFHAYNALIHSQPPSIPPVQDLFACGLPTALEPVDSHARIDQAADSLLTALSNAVGVRVRTIPMRQPSSSSSSSSTTTTTTTTTARVGVLFSGGLDSVVLAALTHFHVVDPNEPIDLLNVCFDSATNFQSPDRLAAQISHAELCSLFPSRRWNFVRVDVPYNEAVDRQHEILDLLAPCDTQMDLNIGTAFWFLSRGHGQLATSSAYTSDSRHVDLNGFLSANRATSEQRDLAAALQTLGLFHASDLDTPIDPSTPLLCPANKCQRKRKPGCALGVCRLCCLKLQRLLTVLRREGTTAPNEAFSSRKQLTALVRNGASDAANDAVIDSLIHVCQRLWPTSGLCRAHRPKTESTQPLSRASTTSTTASTHESTHESIHFHSKHATTARVLLVGIGADEQLGGYGRHKTAFLQRGMDGLKEELAKDMRRIWKRNLGRDDRCLSAHGREARFPFLDESVVRLIAALPLECVCDFEKPRGDGDKRVLRLAARQLGLANCAGLAKRAIQFGTRIAKHANVATFGSNRQASGGAKIRSPRMEDDNEEE